MTDDDKSLGDQHTFDGETPEDRDNSLGDEMTYADQAEAGPSSLGDEMTFAGVAEGLEDDLVDDGMEVIDLEERYTIEGELGKGGMGEVLLATDTRLEIQVAIKRVLGKAARSKKAWQRFENGAKTIAKLDHPNIVRVYEYGLAKDGPFMVLECVTGGSLLDRCKQGPIPLEEAVDIACQLCDGIAKAHKEGIVHRDIKPANVLMTEEGIPKLNDFDLAKAETADMGMTQEGAVLGTLAFMPPEQQKDAALVDQRSDLWSLAATLYQMVTGEPPRVIDLDTVPQELRSCLAKALKTSKDDRYQSAREFRDALRASMSAPVPAAVEAVTDLGVGQCPECHAKNKDTSKFCTKCSTALRVDCLNCGESIPVWHPGCGQCGTMQSELIQQRKDEVDAKRTEAETLADQYEFDKAIALAAEIVEIEDKRWSHQLGWADQFIAETQQEKERRIESAQAVYEEASQHNAAYDYESAARVLAGVDVSIMESLYIDASGLVEEEQEGTYSKISLLRYAELSVSKRDELDELMATIKERVKARDLDGLLEQVDRALELDPNREKLIPLRDQLQKRQAARAEKYDEIHKQARQQLNEGNAKAALRTVSRIKEDGFPRRLKELKQQLTEMVELENKLTALVKEAKADGQIDQDEIDEILPKAKQYLAMNPDHAVVRKLSDDLRKRSLSIQVVDLEERYTIESVLGEGGMGEVLLATDKRLDRKVAIKRVLGKAARSAKAWQRFENGAKTIAKLNHPNIVQVYEYGRAKDGPFMILECVTGGSLLDKCQQGRIPLEEAIEITCQLCDGIGKAHAAGIIHRDIKPANVLMTEEGIPKLNDFDLAKGEFSSIVWVAPEQQKDATLVDLWSLAATLYQMVTGEPPRGGIFLDRVPQELRSCLAKALKTSKDDRYQSARELRDALRASLSAPVPAAVEAVTDLGVGQCPECHAQNKDTSKFCTNCGSSLKDSGEQMSLGMKQTQDNPWDQVEAKYPADKLVKGRVRNLTNYGAFIELEEGIEGLLHVSDLSWTREISHPNEMLEKGQEVKCKILAVDIERRRIALGMKQILLSEDDLFGDDDFEIDRGQAETLKEQQDQTDLPASVRHKNAAKMLGVSVDRLTEMRNNRDIEGFRDAGKWKYKIEELKRVAADLGLTLDTSALSQGDSENGIDFDGPISKGQDQTQGRMGGLFGGGL